MSENTKNGSSNSKGDSVRNLCIMAHVDHGKTTLADTLIATNGIISENQAGSIKYMDSRPDEMERGITMKSSCITLAYPHQNKSYLINLVDSPGHVDFTSEVSTAVRLCDGCILVVDVVEGLCAQTKAVMRQAWVAGVKPVLVMNKLDRLIVEKELTPLDAYYHLAHVLEQVNAYMGELYNTDMFGRTSVHTDATTTGQTGIPSSPIKSSASHSLTDWTVDIEDDSHLYFNPTAGNVVFASAIDGWGFGIGQFAEQFSSKMGMSLTALSQTLWGDFYIGSKGGEKRIMKGARDKRKNPLFVSLILDNLYQLYRKVRPATAPLDEVRKIASSLHIEVPARLYEAAGSSRDRFMYICAHWLPLSTAVLSMVVEQLPPPTHMSEERARKLLTTATNNYSGLPPHSRALFPHLLHCSNHESAPLVVYVSKMFGVSVTKLDEAEQKLAAAQARASGSQPQQRFKPRSQTSSSKSTSAEGDGPGVTEAGANGPEDTAGEAGTSGTVQPPPLTPAADETVDQPTEQEEEVEELLAFARVFSGSLRAGQEVYVLGPKHNPSSIVPLLSPEGHLSEADLQRCPHLTKCKVGSVFLLLGREVQCLPSAGAGLMIGIRGLTGLIIKSGSLSSSPSCPPFTHVIDSSFLGLVDSAAANHGLGVAMAGGDPSGPLLRVQVLPRNPRDLGRLREGLRLLNQADPCVQVWLDGSGAYMVGAAGEVHLQRCLTDLQERYARTAITASDPFVPFRETVVERPLMDATNEAIDHDNVDTTQQEGDGSVLVVGPLGRLRLRALPLPSRVTEILLASSALLKPLFGDTSQLQAHKGLLPGAVTLLDDALLDDRRTEKLGISGGGERVSLDGDKVNDELAQRIQHDININEDSDNTRTSSAVPPPRSFPSSSSCSGVGSALTCEAEASLDAIYRQVKEALNASGSQWEGAADHIWSVGPGYCGPNVLLNKVQGYQRPSLWHPTAPLPDSPLSAMDHGLVTGFQLCCAGGTLCDEPLMGVCFVVEEWEPPADQGLLPPGKVIAVSKELFSSALEEQPRRLMVATYSCVVNVTTEVVGRVYSVLGRRHGRILHGDVTEGSTSWNVIAYLPIVESIDFANEIRKATSGEAAPQLLFSHWETMDVDPFWDPSTAEELKLFGEKADTDNLARQYMNAIRRRKGIKEYNKKIVEHGEKQRTLTKNK